MNGRDEIVSRVRALLAQVLGVPAAAIGQDYSAESTAEWTSLNHLMLVSQIESEFGVFFSSDELQGLTSLDRIVMALERHRSGGT